MTGKASTRQWGAHERNYSGGRFGVWHDDHRTMLRVEAGVGDVTASIRANEAWDLGLRLSPALAKRIDYLFSEMKKAQAALHAFTWADTLAPTLRKIAGEWDCGDGCERAGCSACCERDEGCRFVEAEEMRQFADALEVAAQLREAARDDTLLAPIEAFGRDAQRLDGEATKAGNSSRNCSETNK